jgi:uncharacterized protein YndB with AHSA1/START domain
MTLWKKLAFGLLTLALATTALAHGPTRQKVAESIVIKASPDKVWALVGDYNGLPGWFSAIEKSTATNGNAVGSVRTLSLKGGGEVIEELEARDDATMTLKYRMKKGDLPVTNYAGVMQVRAGDTAGTSVVEWKGSFYRGYPNNNPPPELNDEAAVKAITDVYRGGLAQLKQTLEK